MIVVECILYMAIFKGTKVPVYIGSSGHIENGKTVHRKGGLKRRIIGKQQKTPRWKLWPEKCVRYLSSNWKYVGIIQKMTIRY